MLEQVTASVRQHAHGDWDEGRAGAGRTTLGTLELQAQGVVDRNGLIGGPEVRGAGSGSRLTPFIVYPRTDCVRGLAGQSHGYVVAGLRKPMFPTQSNKDDAQRH